MQNDGSQSWLDQYPRGNGRSGPAQQPGPQQEVPRYEQQPIWPHQGVSYAEQPSTEQARHHDRDERQQPNVYPGYSGQTQGPGASYPPSHSYGAQRPFESGPSSTNPQLHGNPTGRPDWADAYPDNAHRERPAAMEHGRWREPPSTTQMQPPQPAMMMSDYRGSAQIDSRTGPPPDQRQMGYYSNVNPPEPSRPADYRKAPIMDVVNPGSAGSGHQAQRRSGMEYEAYESVAYLRRGSAPLPVDVARSTAGPAKEYAAESSTAPGMFHVTGAESSNYLYARAPAPPVIQYVAPTPRQLPTQYHYVHSHGPPPPVSSGFPSTQRPPEGGYSFRPQNPGYSQTVQMQLQRPPSPGPAPQFGQTPQEAHERGGPFFVRHLSGGGTTGIGIQQQPPHQPVALHRYSGPSIHGQRSLADIRAALPLPLPPPPQPTSRRRPTESRRRRSGARTPAASRSMPNLLESTPLEVNPGSRPQQKAPTPILENEGDGRPDAPLPRQSRQAEIRATAKALRQATDTDVVMRDAPPRHPGVITMADYYRVGLDTARASAPLLPVTQEGSMSRRDNSWRLQPPAELPRRSKSVDMLGIRNLAPSAVSGASAAGPSVAIAAPPTENKGKEKATALGSGFSEAELETSRILTEMSAHHELYLASKLQQLQQPRASPSFSVSTSSSVLGDHDKTVSASPALSASAQPHRNQFVLIDCAKAFKRYSRSYYTVGNGPMIQNKLTDFVENLRYHASEMLRIESRFTHEAMQEWISDNHEVDEYTTMVTMTNYIGKPLTPPPC